MIVIELPLKWPLAIGWIYDMRLPEPTMIQFIDVYMQYQVLIY